MCYPIFRALRRAGLNPKKLGGSSLSGENHLLKSQPLLNSSPGSVGLAPPEVGVGAKNAGAEDRHLHGKAQPGPTSMDFA